MNDVNRRGRRELIALAGEGDGPTNKQRARLRASVLARVGASAIVGTAAATMTAKAAAATVGAGTAVNTPPIVAGGFAAKVIVALALVTGVSASAYFVVARAARPASVVVVSPAEPSPAPTAAPFTHASAPAIATVTPEAPPVVSSPAAGRDGIALRPVVRPTPSPTAAAATKPAETFEAETRALRDALAMLRDGHAEEARTALDAQDRLYPEGALSEERGAARIDALCTLGRTEDARAVAARFFQDHPASLLGPRVRASCAGSLPASR